LDVPHPKAWGWHIWVYLLTKNISAGAMMVAPFFGLLLIPQPVTSWVGVVPELVALVFLGITGFLLVHDLGRPERFWRILFAPNRKSWLVKGTWYLTAFGLLATASAVFRGLIGNAEFADLLRWINLPFAVMASGYTAFLFKQCRGRDLWLSKDLFWHLLLQAALMGAGIALLLRGDSSAGYADTLFVILAAVNGAWIAFGVRHKFPTLDGQKAHALLYTSGKPRLASVCLYASALVLLAAARVESLDLVARIAAVALTWIALLTYEKAFIDKGQEIPNS
jgi:formate-dependent nitrite reductase membrane component NrfD